MNYFILKFFLVFWLHTFDPDFCVVGVSKGSDGAETNDWQLVRYKLKISILVKDGRRSFMGYNWHQPTGKKHWLSFDGLYWWVKSCNILIYIY